MAKKAGHPIYTPEIDVEEPETLPLTLRQEWFSAETKEVQVKVAYGTSLRLDIMITKTGKVRRDFTIDFAEFVNNFVHERLEDGRWKDSE